MEGRATGGAWGETAGAAPEQPAAPENKQFIISNAFERYPFVAVLFV